MQHKLLSLMIVSSVLAACSSTPQKAEIAPEPSFSVAAKAAAAPTSAAMESAAQKQERIVKLLASKSIYFDYDNFIVRAEFHDLVMQNAELLKSLSAAQIMLEGNADERGSSEYNLALGQKRADAVKKALKSLGVPDKQLEAISYGKEKPRATCHDEKCWAENRRVDFSANKALAR